MSDSGHVVRNVKESTSQCQDYFYSPQGYGAPHQRRDSGMDQAPQCFVDEGFDRLPRAIASGQRSRKATATGLTIAPSSQDQGLCREGDAVLLRLRWADLVTTGAPGPLSQVQFPGGWGTVIQVRPDSLPRLACPSDAIQFYVLRSQPLTGDNAITVPSETLQQLSCRLDPMVTLLSNLLIALAVSDRPEVPSLFEQIAAALRLHVLNRYQSELLPQRSTRGGLAPWQLRRAMDLLEVQAAENVCLTDVAHACGLSANHFGRAFRKSTGLPLHRWLLERRIEKARLLLETTNKPLTEVALICGFTDQSHFTRAFSTTLGISPGRWRRRWRSDDRTVGTLQK